MERRDVLAYARYGVAYPVAVLAATAGAASLAGVDTGLAVLFVSMVAASVLVGAYIEGTRAQGGDRTGGAERRTALGVRAELTGGTEAATGGPSRATVVATGLFVLSALATLWLGGSF